MKTIISLALILALISSTYAATYYVAPTHGSVSPAGSAPGTSITNAFKQLNTVLNTYASVGDVIIISPESPVFECINLSRAFASGPVHIRGDIWNESGFTNATGARVAPGPVIWSNKTSGWTSAGAADDTFDMNGYSNVTMYAIYLHNQAGGRGVKANNNSRKLYATNCTFVSSGSYAVDFFTGLPDGFYLVADSCNFICLFTTSNGLSLGWAGVSGSDWDMQVLTKNSVFVSTGSYAAGGFKGSAPNGTAGGWLSTNDLFFSDEGFVTGGSSTNTLPYIFDGSIIFGTSTISHTGQVRSVRSVWNGPAIGTLTLNDSSQRTYTNDLPATILNFGHGRKVGLGYGAWFSPLYFNPVRGFGSTNGLAFDGFHLSRVVTNTIGPFEPASARASARSN